MKWQVWWRKQPQAPAMATHPPQVQPKAEAGIVVDEVDTSAMSRTGIHRAWDRLAGKFKDAG